MNKKNVVRFQFIRKKKLCNKSESRYMSDVYVLMFRISHLSIAPLKSK